MNNSIFGESGVQLTILLVVIPVLTGLIIAIVKTYGTFRNLRARKLLHDFEKKIENLSPEEITLLDRILEQVDQLNLLKARARYTLNHFRKANLA